MLRVTYRQKSTLKYHFSKKIGIRPLSKISSQSSCIQIFSNSIQVGWCPRRGLHWDGVDGGGRLVKLIAKKQSFYFFANYKRRSRAQWRGGREDGHRPQDTQARESSSHQLNLSLISQTVGLAWHEGVEGGLSLFRGLPQPDGGGGLGDRHCQSNQRLWHPTSTISTTYHFHLYRPNFLDHLG